MDMKIFQAGARWGRILRESVLANIPDRKGGVLIRKVLLMNGIFSVGFCILLILGCISFSQEDIFQGILDCLMAFLVLIFLLLMRFYQLYHLCALASVAAIYCFYLYLFVAGVAHGNGFMWYYTYPLVALFLLGTRNGSLATILLIVPTLLFLGINLSSSAFHLYDVCFVSRFVPSFLTVFFFAYIYERSREKAEKELLATYREQEQVIQERTEKIEKQQAQMAHSGRLVALGEMASGIAHEINQPLCIISLAQQYLRKKWPKEKESDPSIGESLDKIARQITRASTIIRNMRSFASSSGKEMTETDLVQPVQTALSFFREQFRLYQIDLQVAMADDLPLLKLDSQKFEQVVINFLSNARYALDEKEEKTGQAYPKTIRVALDYQAENNRVVFMISDNGMGMSEGEKERCLEPFFTTKAVGKGTGLGLSICHKIVDEFNGTIEVESEKGMGAAFRIIIPVVED